MIIIVAVFTFFSLSLWFEFRRNHNSVGWLLATFVSGFMALCVLLAWSIVYAEAATKRAEISALVDTIQHARASGHNPLESAAINLKVAEANGWIAAAKYWNGTVFDPLWPDWVDDLHPVD